MSQQSLHILVIWVAAFWLPLFHPGLTELGAEGKTCTPLPRDITHILGLAARNPRRALSLVLGKSLLMSKGWMPRLYSLVREAMLSGETKQGKRALRPVPAQETSPWPEKADTGPQNLCCFKSVMDAFTLWPFLSRVGLNKT